jgi:hypothetical protein
MKKIIQPIRDAVADKLQLTLDQLKNLSEDYFCYEKFISKFDNKNQCGTICCVAGWYPKWFPHAGLKWTNLLPDNKTHVNDVCTFLANYHLLSRKVILDLFYGGNLLNDSYRFKIKEISIESSKFEVEQRFSAIIALLRSGKLDEFITIDNE